MALQRIALGLCYDGATWHGWQKQPSGRTVQDQLEKVLSQFLAEPISTICAGRTDTGVHALSQVVHLDTRAHRTQESWLRGINALLPPSISVQWAKPVSSEFHARFSAQNRRYVYVLRNARIRSPLWHGRVGWVYQPLVLEHMRQAAQYFLGEHDFSAFRAAECQAASPVRTITQLDIHQKDELFIFEFSANAFLHHMIRNLMGSLVYVGMQRQSPDWIVHLLQQKDRHLSAPTFAADGLYLAGVDYGEQHGLPQSTALQVCQQHLGISW